MTVLIDSYRLYNKTGVHVLPIIQSVILRCMHSWNIYEHLMSTMATKDYLST